VADVFVSYSRRDSDFVRRLAESVSEHGKDVWLDTDGIADTEVFPEAIKRAIEGADAFLFVITPASVASTYCENEVEYARDMQKRIVPVLRAPVADPDLPAEIRDRNWIPFTSDEEFDASLGRLLTALDTDLEAAKAHTRWLLKALEWDSERRDRSFLLRGSELKAAEAWLAASREDADPAPTPLQREYLLASREAAARRQRMLVGASLAVAAVAIGLLIFALISRSQAVSEQVSAQSAADAEQSQAELPDDPEISLVLGIRAVRQRDTPGARFALREALDASPLQRAFPTVGAPGSCNGAGLTVALSPSGGQLAEGTCAGRLALLDFASGRLLHTDHIPGGVVTLAYSPDGALLALGTTSSIVLVNARTGALVAQRSALSSGTVRVSAGSPGITALAFSPDGRELAANDIRGVKLWRIPALTGRQLASYPNSGGTIVFARGGRELIVGGFDDNAFNVYALPSGRLLRRVVPVSLMGGTSTTTLALSPNGSQLAVASMNNFSSGTVGIYSTRTWRQQYLLTTVHNVSINSLAFSPDGARLAVGAADGTAGVWSLLTREQLAAYDGATAVITAIDFTPNGRSVLTASNDGTVRLWRASGAEQLLLPIAGSIGSVAMSQKLLLLTANVGGRVWLYSYRLPGGESLGRTPVGAAGSTGGMLSNDARIGILYKPPSPFTGVPVKGPVKVVDVATRRVTKTLPALAVFQAAVSPDDSRLFLRYQGPGVPNGLGDMEVVDLATGHTVALQTAFPCVAPPEAVVFSGNDSDVAAGYFCGYAVVWSTRTGRIVRQIQQGGQISDVDLSPDGLRLLVTSWDSRATIWSVARRRQPLVQLIGHTRGLNGGSFAADGTEVVTTALDDTARVWDAYTGQELRVLSFATFQGALAVSPGGGMFALGEYSVQPGAENVVRVFDTCPACENGPVLLRQAQPHVTPYLTTLERTVLGA
jgi:WD40 repeat protein